MSYSNIISANNIGSPITRQSSHIPAPPPLVRSTRHPMRDSQDPYFNQHNHADIGTIWDRMDALINNINNIHTNDIYFPNIIETRISTYAAAEEPLPIAAIAEEAEEAEEADNSYVINIYGETPGEISVMDQFLDRENPHGLDILGVNETVVIPIADYVDTEVMNHENVYHCQV